MASTWGAIGLNILYGTYRTQAINANISEIKLLPSSTSTDISTALQQGGRDRKRFTFNTYVVTWAEYVAFQTDYIAATERIFADGNVSLTCIISDLSPANIMLSDYIMFTMSLIEV